MNDIFDFFKFASCKKPALILYATDHDDDDCNEQRVKSY